MKLDQIIEEIKLMPENVFNILNNKIPEYTNILTYKFVGQGGSSIIYSINNKYALKICKKINSKDIDILKKLQNTELANHTLILYTHFILHQHLFIIEQLANNTLDEWLKYKHTDKQWIYMLIQVLYTIYILQTKYNIFHGDITFRNIMFKKYKKAKLFKFNDITFKTKIFFIIIDFGRTQYIGASNNKVSDKEIKTAIMNNEDVKLLSISHNKNYVNLMIKKYNKINITRTETETGTGTGTNWFKQEHILRATLYDLIEHKILKTKSPNKSIQQIISSLYSTDLLENKIIKLWGIIKK